MTRRDTRLHIVETARELFWAKGYGSTSIADILSRSQVNSGSLYHFFPSKQDLLIAVLDGYATGIEQMLLEPAWNGVEDPVERVFALLDFYRALIVTTDCTYGCPIGSLALELHEADPAVLAKLAENFTGWTGAIQSCLEMARERFGGADLRSLAEFTLTVMEGAVMQARTHRDVGYFDRAIEQLRLHYDQLQTAQSATGDRVQRGGKINA